jgi:hypothetical protein
MCFFMQILDSGTKFIRPIRLDAAGARKFFRYFGLALFSGDMGNPQNPGGRVE